MSPRSTSGTVSRLVGHIPALLVLLLVAAAAAAFAAAALADAGWVVDDAYIYFRYAENLQHGLGLRWNAGMEPAEGYVDIVHILVLTLLGWLGVSPIDAALGMSVAAAGGIVAILVSAARPGRWHFPITVIPAIVFLLDANTHAHAIRGLDTLMFAFFALAMNASLAALLAREGRSRTMGILAGVAGSLVFLTRPEGALLIAAGWCTTAILLACRKQSLRWAVESLMLVAGVALVYWIWRLAYFRHWLPNPFYLKADVEGFCGLVETGAFLRRYRASLAVSALLLVATLALLMARKRGDRAGSPISASPILAAAACLPWILYVAKIYHDVGFHHRFAFPVLPIVLFGISDGGSSLLARVPGRRSRSVVGWIAAGSLVAVSAGNLRAASALRARPGSLSDRATESFLRLGQMLHDTGLADRLTLVCSHAGATPFVAKCRHIDPVGLTDNSMCARTPPEERQRYWTSLEYDVRTSQWFPASPGASRFDEDPGLESSYLREFRLSLPEGFDETRLLGWQREALDRRKREAFEEMCELRDRNTLIGEMHSSRGAGRLFVYVKKSSPLHDELMQKLGPLMDTAAPDIDKDIWPY